ncbi:MAG: hypothetical protein VXY70_05515, partial [Actinomycetota bacterium]|nr:hypothetical protein [Actinomycetota bacterium]
MDDTTYGAATRKRPKRETLEEERSAARAEADTAVKLEDVKEEAEEDACPLLDVLSELEGTGDIDADEVPGDADRDDARPSS